MLTDAPQKPDLLTELPPFTVTASSPVPGAFSLIVHSGAYTGSVRVSATPPVSPGLTRFRPDQFRFLVTETNLTAPLTTLTSNYLARFPAPLAGMQLAVMLIPVTPNGFQGQPIWVPVTVANGPMTADAPTLTLQK